MSVFVLSIAPKVIDWGLKVHENVSAILVFRSGVHVERGMLNFLEKRGINSILFMFSAISIWCSVRGLGHRF